MSEAPDGNPVFTYRAGFRMVGRVVQRWAFLLGLASLLVGGTTWLVAADGSHAQNAGFWLYLIGLGLLFAGVLWGFWWRGHLREDFRRQFGNL